MKHTTTAINLAAFIWSTTGIKPEISKINSFICEFSFDNKETKSFSDISELQNSFYKSPIMDFLDKRSRIIRDTKNILQ